MVERDGLENRYTRNGIVGSNPTPAAEYFMNKTRSFIFSLITLTGTIIGVGMFSLPYLASQTGFLTMVVYLFILGAVAILIHLIFAELSLNTPDFSRLPGFANFYLGKWGKRIATCSAIIGLFGTILAYLIVGGEFLSNLFSPVFGGSPLIYTLIYFVAGAILIYFGIKTIEKIELWGMVLFFGALIFIFIKSLPIFNLSNLFIIHGSGFAVQNLFFLFGPILFSLWGLTLVPELEEQLGENKNLLKKIIPSAILISILTYIFFTVIVLGVCGNQTTESALVGLNNFFSSKVMAIVFLFGIIATFTSFIALGLTLKKVLNYDLKIPKKLAWFIACFVPLSLFLLGFNNFISVISFVGGIMLSIDGILVCLMYQKLKKTKKATALSLTLIFICFLAIFFSLKTFIF